jgi:hypothetical protein
LNSLLCRISTFNQLSYRMAVADSPAFHDIKFSHTLDPLRSFATVRFPESDRTICALNVGVFTCIRNPCRRSAGTAAESHACANIPADANAASLTFGLATEAMLGRHDPTR